MDPKPATAAKKSTETKHEPTPASLAAVPDVPPAPRALSVAEKKKLSDRFLEALKAKDDAEAALVAARDKCSLAAKAIVDGLGHKGPFTIGGRLFTASKSKASDGYTMREVSGSKDDLG